MNKIILEQRDNATTTNKIDTRKPSIKISVTTVKGSVGFMKDTLPAGFTPDKATVTLDNVELTSSECVAGDAQEVYNNDVIVYDANGVECISDQTLFTNLGITNPTHIRRTSNRIKEATYKDTGDKMFIQGVDYLELDVTNSKTVGVAQRMISHDTPLVDNTKPVNRMATNTIDSAVANSDMCSDSPDWANRNTSADTIPAVANATNSDMHSDSPGRANRNASDMVGIKTDDMNRRKDTVWTVPAAKKIALRAKTTRGDNYAEHLLSLESNSNTNTDFMEALVELHNDKAVATEIPHLEVPEGHSRVEDTIRKISTPVSHKQACSLGKTATRLSKATGVAPVKVTSSTYPNTFVNAYPNEILDDVAEDWFGDDYDCDE